MTNYASCNTSPLTAYVPTAANPWDAIKVRHLHKRLGFGVGFAQLTTALSSSPGAYVDQLIDNAIALPYTTPPAWANLDPADYPANGFTYNEDENALKVEDTQYDFLKECLDNGVRGRLTLFWHNILVTRVVEYGFAGYAYRYFLTLQRNCLGNFKDFIHEIGLNDAMLKFLNGFENTAGSPNENYARELYELFTLGEGNGYTEDDIVETSRALTGYNDYANGENSSILFNPANFDTDAKTIFGQTGNWGYDDVIDILFEQKSTLIAEFICEKVYAHFVSPEIDDQIRTSIITPLASIFIADNYNIATLFKTLLKSEHFFDEQARNVIIKSPIDLMLEFMVSSGLDFGSWEMNKESIKNIAGLFDQDIMNPPTVAGWDGDKAWINSGTITFRGAFLSDEMLVWAFEQDEEQFRQFAKDVSGNSTDADVVTQEIMAAILGEVPYSVVDIETGVDIFKSRVPSNYFEQNTWSLDFTSVPLQVRDLIEYIVNLPDNQIK